MALGLKRTDARIYKYATSYIKLGKGTPKPKMKWVDPNKKVDNGTK